MAGSWKPRGSPTGAALLEWAESGGEVIARLVDPFVLFAQVVGPVVVEVAVGADGAEFEDGFCSGQAPAGAGDVHAVFDQVTAGALDHPGGDRPAAGERGGVVQVGLLGGEVARAGVSAVAFVPLVSVGGGAAAYPGGDLGSLALQHLLSLGGNPGLGVGVTGLEERPGRFPQVFQLSTVRLVRAMFSQVISLLRLMRRYFVVEGCRFGPRRVSSRRSSRFSPWACSSAARRAAVSLRCCFFRWVIWLVSAWMIVLSLPAPSGGGGFGRAWSRRRSIRARRSVFP